MTRNTSEAMATARETLRLNDDNSIGDEITHYWQESHKKSHDDHRLGEREMCPKHGQYDDKIQSREPVLRAEIRTCANTYAGMPR